MKKKTEFPKALKLGPTGATHSASALFTDSRKSYPHPNSFCVFSLDNDLPSFTHRFSSQKPFLLWMFEFIMRI